MPVQGCTLLYLYIIKVVYKIYFVTGTTQRFSYLLYVILPIQRFFNSQTKKFYSFIKSTYARLIYIVMFAVCTCGVFINEQFTMHGMNNVKTRNFIFVTYLIFLIYLEI